MFCLCFFFFFFFNDTATTEIYTLSLHDALPISIVHAICMRFRDGAGPSEHFRSEEHTSELQSPYVISYAVFCLKKKNRHKITRYAPHMQVSEKIPRNKALV